MNSHWTTHRPGLQLSLIRVPGLEMGEPGFPLSSLSPLPLCFPSRIPVGSPAAHCQDRLRTHTRFPLAEHIFTLWVYTERKESQPLSMMDGGSLGLLRVVLPLGWRQPPAGPSLNSISASGRGLSWGGLSVGCNLLLPHPFTQTPPLSLEALPSPPPPLPSQVTLCRNECF